MKGIVIADDFTGACDTGCKLLSHSDNVKVVFNYEESECGSVVIDTETRTLTESTAYDRVQETVRDIVFNAFDFVFKKIDSAFRGNITSEIMAVDSVFHSELVIITPAFPKMKRSLIHGILYLDNVRLAKTGFANDPLNPVTDDNTVSIIRKAFDETVGHINIENIRNEKINFDGTRIFVCDAETDEDLNAIVNAALEKCGKPLFVGTAGLAEAVMAVFNKTTTTSSKLPNLAGKILSENAIEQQNYSDSIFSKDTYEIQTSLKHQLNKKSYRRPSFAIVGSLSDKSREQVNYALNNDTSIACVSISKFLNGETNADYYASKAIAHLNNGRSIIVTTDALLDAAKYDLDLKFGKMQGLNQEEVSAFAKKCLGQIGAALVLSHLANGCLLTGGDTAMAVLNELSADGAYIEGEWKTGIPVMRLCGGKAHGFNIMTKAGSFGEKEDVNEALNALNAMH